MLLRIAPKGFLPSVTDFSGEHVWLAGYTQRGTASGFQGTCRQVSIGDTQGEVRREGVRKEVDLGFQEGFEAVSRGE